MRWRAAGSLVCLLICMTACSRAPELVRGPIDLDDKPIVVPFEQPVISTGPDWDLWLEFSVPGDSHAARRIHIALMTSDGERHPLTGIRLDRRGEGLVSLIGRAGPPESPQAGAAPTYVAVEIRSEIPLRLRGIRGDNRLR